jgi:hypothetical protein
MKPVFNRIESFVYIFCEAVSVMTHSNFIGIGSLCRLAVIADCGTLEVASHS